MNQGARTAVTLSVLGLILVVGAAWGWSALTKPLPGKVELAACVSRDVSKGEKVFPDQVVVSVLNGGTREGLAGRTMQLFTDRGFVEGDSQNAPGNADVASAAIWTDDPRNPAVQLVASRLGPDVRVVDRRSRAVGVVVVVGDDFRRLSPGRRSVRAVEDTEICSPPQ